MRISTIAFANLKRRKGKALLLIVDFEQVNQRRDRHTA
jgi:hypothetical protein